MVILNPPTQIGLSSIQCEGLVMEQLPEPLQPLIKYPQFLLFKLVWDATKQKYNKIPISPFTYQSYPKGSDWQNTPGYTTDAKTAIKGAELMGNDYGVGFLFTSQDPFFFLDIDNCLNPDGVSWSPPALEICNKLYGAAVEISQSGRGLHIFGRGDITNHSCKNTTLRLELYTQSRFVALTGTNVIGSANKDCSLALPSIVETYFAPKAATTPQAWTEEPVAGWDGIRDDNELILKAMASQSAAGIFNGKSTFASLWNNDIDTLARSYPDPEGTRPYDSSSADAALAQHLAFWTGNNCERIKSLMWLSALSREKWEREDYLIRTITRAVSLQTTFHGMKTEVSLVFADKYGAPRLRSSSDAQRNYANSIRETKLSLATEAEAYVLCETSGTRAQAKFWLNNQERTPAELVAMLRPIEGASNPLGNGDKGAEVITGYQYLSANLQIEHFSGCVYIQDQHKIFTPSGAILKSEQFNATYGGYVFQLDEPGNKTTRKAWEAFTESQVVRYPKAQSTCFRPELEPAALVKEEGCVLVNTFVPIDTPRIEGDVQPFLNHLSKILPDNNDREILLAYMAAIVQYPGVKFQWAPLLQGAEGNGKTLFTRCVAFAVGRRYTHFPPANEISEKFNEWLFNKIFIGIEDVYVPDHKKEIIEVLKPMITNDKLAMRAMQQAQVMGDNRANFMLNSNHKDAIRKNQNDRRFAVFFSAQQTAEDIVRDEMGDSYFPNLYDWLTDQDGYAKVANFLSTYQIPAALNPATVCHRAPQTSSTAEAVQSSLGMAEQIIQDAVDLEEWGFRGNLICTKVASELLKANGKILSPQKVAEVLTNLDFIKHTALMKSDGKITVEGIRRRLYVKRESLTAKLPTKEAVAAAWKRENNPNGPTVQPLSNRLDKPQPP